jgi:Bax protein
LPRPSPVGLGLVIGVAAAVLLACLIHYLTRERLEPDTLAVTHVAELVEHYAEADYDLEGVRGGAVVPRLFLGRLPSDWPDTPTAEERKQLFVMAVLPLVLRANERVLADRDILLDLAAARSRGAASDNPENKRLAALARRYGTGAKNLDEMLVRVDAVPPSLALAQAAVETGWGSSRFALEGNALFGQWTFEQGMGMVPARRDPESQHEVRAFTSLARSVDAYLRNINRHPAYASLRRLRAAMRREGRSVDGSTLAGELTLYSARGGYYVEALRAVIEANRLAWLDSARLDGPLIGRVPTSEVDAALGHGSVPLVVDGLVEDELLVRGHGVPGVGGKFGLELASSPTGVAEGEETLLGARAGGNGPQHLQIGGERYLVVDDKGAVADVIGGMEHEPAGALDRTAVVHADLGLSGRVLDTELLQQRRYRTGTDQAVEDQAHGPGGVVPHHVDNGLDEARVAHLGRGHQKPAGERFPVAPRAVRGVDQPGHGHQGGDRERQDDGSTSTGGDL